MTLQVIWSLDCMINISIIIYMFLINCQVTICNQSVSIKISELNSFINGRPTIKGINLPLLQVTFSSLKFSSISNCCKAFHLITKTVWEYESQ